MVSLTNRGNAYDDDCVRTRHISGPRARIGPSRRLENAAEGRRTRAQRPDEASIGATGRRSHPRGALRILAVFPYVALVHIGDVLPGPPTTQVRRWMPTPSDRWIRILVLTFALRLLSYFVALLVTHLADIKLGHIIQLRMVKRFASAAGVVSPRPIPVGSARRSRTMSAPSTNSSPTSRSTEPMPS